MHFCIFLNVTYTCAFTPPSIIMNNLKNSLISLICPIIKNKFKNCKIFIFTNSAVLMNTFGECIQKPKICSWIYSNLIDRSVKLKDQSKNYAMSKLHSSEPNVLWCHAWLMLVTSKVSSFVQYWVLCCVVTSFTSVLVSWHSIVNILGCNCFLLSVIWSCQPPIKPACAIVMVHWSCISFYSKIEKGYPRQQ